MKILFLHPEEKVFAYWQSLFKEHEATKDWQLLRPFEVKDHSKIEIALAWRPAPTIFSTFPSLRFIQSLGMGVDHLLGRDDLPESVVISRIVDPDMNQQMAQYVLYGALRAFRQLPDYNKQQRKHYWQPLNRFYPNNFTIGILGFGVLGQTITETLHTVGFDQIRIWSKSQKSTPLATSYQGEEELNSFLNGVKCLICLLPLTPETHYILNKETLSQVAKGCFLINSARGAHLKEEDLIPLLNSNQLSGALLDVFEHEPLPKNHPFWTHPQIEITPHIASKTNPTTAFEQIVRNIKKVSEGELPLNRVDIHRGY